MRRYVSSIHLSSICNDLTASSAQRKFAWTHRCTMQSEKNLKYGSITNMDKYIHNYMYLKHLDTTFYQRHTDHLLGAQQQGAMCRSCRQVSTHTKVTQGERKVLRSLRPHRIFGVWKETKQLGLEATSQQSGSSGTQQHHRECFAAMHPLNGTAHYTAALNAKKVLTRTIGRQKSECYWT